jgi:two-component system sensor histidine kinase and response regulator WspE
MNQQQNRDLSQFSMLDLFRMEADGQTQALTEGLLAMERGAGDAATIESMMRAAHSIKGAAAIVGLDVVVQLAHGMEDAFVAAQHGRLQLTPARIDVLLAGVDLVLQFSTLGDSGADAWLASNAGRVEATMESIVGIARIGAATSPALAGMAPVSADAWAMNPGHPAESPAGDDPSQRAPGAAAKAAGQSFDRLLALASESRISAHLIHPFVGALQRSKRNQAILFQALEKLHEAVVASGDSRLVGQSMLAMQQARPLKQAMLEHLADAETFERRLLTLSSGLLDEVLALRMRPFRDGVQAFPRMVRDLARSLGKQAQLVIAGEDTPVDREVLARIEGPLNHMLRNAVDHGMETPAERLAAGKPAHGTIRLEAKHRAGLLTIDLSDDGRGVDIERIREVVVRRKLASPAMGAALSRAELMEFLFLPGFSLKESPNEISGRGVGLDIVQDTIREQNGSVRMESDAGHGFRTTITLPLTQSIVRALVVEVQGEAYAVPIVKVERVLKIPQAHIHTLENKQFFDFDDEQLGLVSAAQVLGLGQLRSDGPELAVVVIGTGSRRHALVVDAIRGEQSLAVQAIASIFGKMRDIMAAAVLDDGLPVLILDVPDLLLSIDKLLHEGQLHQLARHGGQEQARAKRILVVDDSLTVREMERKLLHRRGYQVDIAVDGIDGWNMVRSGDYQLVITDVDMPRMDGIELVGLIKNDIELRKLPVMIVSYKDRPEDRARGLTAGADYYLAKGSFHDDTLLDAVVDLIGVAGL